MNANGKRARRQTGLNRHGVHHANHAVKSDAKVRRTGWVRTRGGKARAA